MSRFMSLFLILTTALYTISCKSDKKLSQSFKGKYTVHVSQINLADLEKASKEVKKEIEKGKKELHDNLAKAQEEVDKEVDIEVNGKKADLKELMGELEKGLEKIIEGAGEVGEGFSNFGKKITENIVKNTTFQADFQENGKLSIGSDNNNINLHSKNLTWAIEDGKLIITDKEGQNNNFSFDMKTKNDKEWELTNDKISLTLTKE